MRRRHTYITLHPNELHTTQHALIDFQTLFVIIVDILIELRNRIDKSVYESNEQADPPSIAKPSDDDCRIFSPIPIRGKGHPPFEREVSGVEVVAERKKESVRKQVNTVTSLSLL